MLPGGHPCERSGTLVVSLRGIYQGVSCLFQGNRNENTTIFDVKIPFRVHKKKNRELIKKTTTATAAVMSLNKIAVHVRYNPSYISLPSSAKQEREITKFCVVWGT